MATLAVTITAASGNAPGSVLRKLASQLNKLSQDYPDEYATGASTVITFDNAPAAGTVSVVGTSGPYTSAKLFA